MRRTEKQGMRTHHISNVVAAVCSAVILLFASEVSAKHLFILSGQSTMARFKPEKVFQPAVEAEFGEENVIVISVEGYDFFGRRYAEKAIELIRRNGD